LFRALVVSPKMRVIVLALAASAALAACGTEKHQADLENGKRLFTGQLENPKKPPTADYQACSACHALARADSTSAVGPSLDAAFSQARKDGFTTATIEGIVHGQILHPRRSSIMPAGLVEGDDAKDVAAYVAQVAGQPGDDKGQLATIGGGCKDAKPIAAKGTTLSIPACDVGLAYASAEATAPAGSVQIVMTNPQPTGHDIALKGDGKGPVVTQGGQSKFTADLKPGKYEYYCSVPGHEAGGMKGTLTVK
jgi:mono/diheme cytochrome c family protein